MFNQCLHTLIQNDPDLHKLSRIFLTFSQIFFKRNLKTGLFDVVC